MARIDLVDLAHSYGGADADPAAFALKPTSMTWRQGGAYALLGPSGCGKTTLLNIISGIVRPSRGKVLFDGKDVSALTTQQRNIAQVFQFPVIYDTMTVGENLAFPLKNRGLPRAEIEARVSEIAQLLDLTPHLARKASRLTADAKQKISLGRGLVRADVAAVLFDEPLTVIDPALKWELRSKLKVLHRALDLTMIYVTHDQTEALTFADTVVVMHEGSVVQTGTPEELFARPAHTFVGYFIGSPGMNVLPAEVQGRQARVAGHALELAPALRRAAGRRAHRDRHPPGIRAHRPARAGPADRRGRAHRRPRPHAASPGYASAISGSRRSVPNGQAVAERRGGPGVRSGADPRLRRSASRRGNGVMEKITNQKAWLLVLPVFALVAFSAVIPLMTVVNYSVQDTFGNNQLLLERRRLVPGAARSLDRAGWALLRLAVAQPRLLGHRAGDRDSARHRGRAGHAARGLGGRASRWSSWRCRCSSRGTSSARSGRSSAAPTSGCSAGR